MKKSKCDNGVKKALGFMIHSNFLATKFRAAPALRAHHHGPVLLICLHDPPRPKTSINPFPGGA